MTKKDNENFTKCWVFDNTYVDAGDIVRYHCHITGIHGGSAHIDCNINVKLNYKTPIVFHNLKI